METTFLCLCYLVTFWALVRRQFTVASLVAGAAVGVRIESAPLAAATVLAAWTAGRREALRALAATLALPATAYLFAWLYFGSPIRPRRCQEIVYVSPPYRPQTCLAELLNVFPFQNLLPSKVRSFARTRWQRAVALLVWRAGPSCAGNPPRLARRIAADWRLCVYP